jgi:hypothetical protein
MNLCCTKHSSILQQKEIEIQLFNLYKKIFSIKLTHDISTLTSIFKKYDGLYCDYTYDYGYFFTNEDERIDYDHYLSSFYTITEQDNFELSYTYSYMFWNTTTSICKCTRLFILLIPCIIFFRCCFYTKQTNLEYYHYYSKFLETTKTIVEICIKNDILDDENNITSTNIKRCPKFSFYFKDLIKNTKSIEKMKDEYANIIHKEHLDELNSKYNLKNNNNQNK